MFFMGQFGVNPMITRVMMAGQAPASMEVSAATRDSATTAAAATTRADSTRETLTTLGENACTSAPLADENRAPNGTASSGAEANAPAKIKSEESITRWKDLVYSIPGHPLLQPTAKRMDDVSAEVLLSLMQSNSARTNVATRSASDNTPGRATTSKRQQSTNDYDSDDEKEANGDGVSQDGASSDTTHTSTTQGKQPSKKRKSTHTVRKEEKATLVEEIKALEDRLAFLRGQVFAPERDENGDVVLPSVSNTILRETILDQQLRFASARSMISSFISLDLAAPLHKYLHLGPDMAQRRAVLLALKPELLRTARRFVEERSKFHDLTKQHASVERFVTSSGDACCLRFYVDQFPSVFSVKHVHDATSFFTSNLEMTITESIGHITIREDDDSGDPSLAQHRLVIASTDKGIIVDTNTVVVSHYNEQENYGILATTYVDEDDLHPYRPLERVRHDVTAVSLITQERDMVVVRRWAHLRMRHSEHIQMPLHVLQMTRESLGHWGEAMMQFVRERVHLMMSSSSQ